MNTKSYYLVLTIFLTAVLSGCIGTKTFHEIARAGDTVALAAGWKHNYSRDNITITITPSVGAPIVYLPNDPAVRAVVNLYPDPLSALAVSPLIRLDMSPAAQIFADTLMNAFTNRETDWWQTSVFIELPTSLPEGVATIEIINSQGDYTYSDVEIVSGVGQPSTYAYTFGVLNNNQIASMERIGNYVIQFSGSTIPYALQLELTHAPDIDQGGAGRAHVVNTRGDFKNAVWSDDGTNLRIIINPAVSQVLPRFSDFKIYVTGGITDLQLVNLKAVDINGNSITGVSASITWFN